MTKEKLEFTRFPPALVSDVILVKEALTQFLKERVSCGLGQAEIDALRWRGAKATAASIVQRLGIRPLNGQISRGVGQSGRRNA